MLTEIVINIFRIIDMFLKRNLAESLFAFTDDHLLFHFKKKKKKKKLYGVMILFLNLFVYGHVKKYISVGP